MQEDSTPNSIGDLLAALADGELDLREHPQALARIAQDPQAAQRLAYQQQLKQACAQAMAIGKPCPEELVAKLRAMSITEQAHGVNSVDAVGSFASPVIGRIGRWLPSAVAAALLIAAPVMFMQASGTGSSAGPAVASLLSVSQVGAFDNRHLDCSAKPVILKDHDRFGPEGDFEHLPGKIADYFHTSADGMALSLDGIGYDYRLTGACSLPGSDGVHIVYRHRENPGRSISLWLTADDGRYAQMDAGRVYVEAGKTLDHPVIIWRSGGLIYYLVGDSLQDAHQAVAVLHQPL